MRYLFEEYAFDTERRELYRGADVVSVAPQVFDLLDYLIRNREHVVSKDDLIKAIWNGRSVSDAALTTRLNVARSAIGDSGDEQRLIKTLPRKGFRFVGQVRETQGPAGATVINAASAVRISSFIGMTRPDWPLLAVFSKCAVEAHALALAAGAWTVTIFHNPGLLELLVKGVQSGQRLFQCGIAHRLDAFLKAGGFDENHEFYFMLQGRPSIAQLRVPVRAAAARRQI